MIRGLINKVLASGLKTKTEGIVFSEKPFEKCIRMQLVPVVGINYSFLYVLLLVHCLLMSTPFSLFQKKIGFYIKK
jgi:hypothetical protein